MTISISLMRKVGSEMLAQLPQGIARVIPGLMVFILLLPGPTMALSSRISMNGNKQSAALLGMLLAPTCR